jgi:hypothetical protein
MNRVDGVSTIGTVNINITYNVVPATYQNIEYVVNLPSIWQEKNAKLYTNDFEDTVLDITKNKHGVPLPHNYGYTTNNTINSSINGKKEYQYVDVMPRIDGLGDYKGSSGFVGFTSGKASSGITGPNIKFRFGRVGYNVDWIV